MEKKYLTQMGSPSSWFHFLLSSASTQSVNSNSFSRLFHSRQKPAERLHAHTTHACLAADKEMSRTRYHGTQVNGKKTSVVVTRKTGLDNGMMSCFTFVYLFACLLVVCC